VTRPVTAPAVAESTCLPPPVAAGVEPGAELQATARERTAIELRSNERRMEFVIIA
jgi:hypothetical protein